MHMARLWDASRKGRGGYSLEGLSQDLLQARVHKRVPTTSLSHPSLLSPLSSLPDSLSSLLSPLSFAFLDLLPPQSFFFFVHLCSLSFRFF